MKISDPKGILDDVMNAPKEHSLRKILVAEKVYDICSETSNGMLSKRYNSLLIKYGTLTPSYKKSRTAFKIAIDDTFNKLLCSLSIIKSPDSSVDDTNSVITSEEHLKLQTFFKKELKQCVTAWEESILKEIKNNERLIKEEQDAISTLGDVMSVEIVNLVKTFTKKGKSSYVSILRGLSSCKYKNDTSSFGVLSEYKTTEIEKRIDFLINTNILMQVRRNASYGDYLSIEVSPNLKEKMERGSKGAVCEEKDVSKNVSDLISMVSKYQSLKPLEAYNSPLALTNLKEWKELFDFIERKPTVFKTSWNTVREKLPLRDKNLLPFIELRLKLSKNEEYLNILKKIRLETKKSLKGEILK